MYIHDQKHMHKKAFFFVEIKEYIYKCVYKYTYTYLNVHIYVNTWDRGIYQKWGIPLSRL
jgi:hypothetical protein